MAVFFFNEVNGGTCMERMLIVAGGPLSLDHLQQEIEGFSGRLMAVDAGAAAFLRLGIKPDVLLGDFDSLPGADVEVLIRDGVEFLRFPAEKDQTDLELALDWAAGQGIKEVRVWGALGGRLDHTLANVGLLLKAARLGLTVWLVDPNHEVRVFEKELQLTARPGWAVSLIPLFTAKGVLTRGLKYPLNRETLHFSEGRGLHNRFVAAEAEILVEEGTLLLVRFAEALDQSWPIL